jgi:hypothetical protein
MHAQWTRKVAPDVAHDGATVTYKFASPSHVQVFTGMQSASGVLLTVAQLVKSSWLLPVRVLPP